MSDVPPVITRFLSAWSVRDPQVAAAEVTDDVVLSDPNERFDGRPAVVDHLELILRRFDFDTPTVDHCVVDGDPTGDATAAFVLKVRMTGRSTRLAGVVTGFEAGVFVDIRGGLIARYQEYWDPAPMARALAGVSGG